MTSEFTKGVYEKNPVLPRLNLTGEGVREETIRHHQKRYELAAKYVPIGGITVDLCCGTGYGTAMVKEAGAALSIGVDLSGEAIAFAEKEYGHIGAEYVHDDVVAFLNAMPANPNVITFFEAMEHVTIETGFKILDACKNSLSRDGTLLLSTPRDIRSDVNPDHITDWTFEELKIALEERFYDVDMFGQDWATGEFTCDSPEEASFFIAVCKNPKTDAGLKS